MFWLKYLWHRIVWEIFIFRHLRVFRGYCWIFFLRHFSQFLAFFRVWAIQFYDFFLKFWLKMTFFKIPQNRSLQKLKILSKIRDFESFQGVRKRCKSVFSSIFNGLVWNLNNYFGRKSAKTDFPDNRVYNIWEFSENIRNFRSHKRKLSN